MWWVACSGARRSDEYLTLLRRTWTAPAPFDFTGEFYRVQRAHCDVHPVTQPHPLIFFGGASPEAVIAGAKHCDVYALFGEPRAAIAERMSDIRAAAAMSGRDPAFSVSFRPILADSESAAWDKAHGIRVRIRDAMGGVNGRREWATARRS